MSLDDDLDRLYQLPLNAFTAARNEIAKSAGARGAEIRKLARPPVAAWAVNQLYWRDRKTYDTLIEAAEAMRAAHAAVLAGKRGDLRFTGKEHEEALEHALKRTMALLSESGHPVTDATRNAVAQTLRALPAGDAPGRLARALSPGGFEMLAGLTVKSGGARAARSGPAPPPSKPDKTGPAKPADDRRQAERAQAAAAAKALREAEQEARRAEFEAARAARAAARADEALADARADLDAAQTRLEKAEAEARAAAKKKQSADRALDAATHEVADARRRVDAAAAAGRTRRP